MATRRWIAGRMRDRVRPFWPIMPGAERSREGWPGWPEKRFFGLVLTHDVESIQGLRQVKMLAEMEMEHGFRSSFNFVPEGTYRVPPELRHWLLGNGFEVGIHDLHHNGKLYASRSAFRLSAKRINHYIHEWTAVGFRSAFMFHELEWLHDLEIQYDLSCFDTDPFEPQPDGVGTIFPFKVYRSLQMSPEADRHASGQSGYVEIPYTLPQDSTLFLLLGEKGIETWKRKAAWIADHGGMVLLNVHPDYIHFRKSEPDSFRYPASWYREFLEHMSAQYSGKFWHALPRDVASLMNGAYTDLCGNSPSEIPTIGLRKRHNHS